MKSKNMYPFYSAVAVILATVCFDGAALVWGQDKPTPQVVPSPIPHVLPENINSLGFGVTSRRSRGRSISVHSKIREAIRNYQAANTEAKKEESKKDISSALSTYFDADMKNREQDIANIEKRIKKLRIQLEKRRAAKDKLVDLQLKVLINQADGLGFYSKPVSNGRPRRAQSTPLDSQLQFDDLKLNR